LSTKLLVLEGNRGDHPAFSKGLIKRGYEVVKVPNGSAAINQLLDIDPDVIIVDASSLRTSGKRICQDLRDEMIDVIPIMLIQPASDQNHDSKNPIKKIDDLVVLTLPFTVQKLVNRLRPLLPGESGNQLRQGPIRLDLEHSRVRCLNQSGKLTPHLCRLLKILLLSPGIVIEREEIFRNVWETEYTADTRTLDVHISWLRKIIEQDPRHPRFIKTIRGIGYRLDV
jgi:DNA-binding response OmpR family regulator